MPEHVTSRVESVFPSAALIGARVTIHGRDLAPAGGGLPEARVGDARAHRLVRQLREAVLEGDEEADQAVGFHDAGIIWIKRNVAGAEEFHLAR